MPWFFACGWWVFLILIAYCFVRGEKAFSPDFIRRLERSYEWLYGPNWKEQVTVAGQLRRKGRFENRFARGLLTLFVIAYIYLFAEVVIYPSRIELSYTLNEITSSFAFAAAVIATAIVGLILQVRTTLRWVGRIRLRATNYDRAKVAIEFSNIRRPEFWPFVVLYFLAFFLPINVLFFSSDLGMEVGRLVRLTFISSVMLHWPWLTNSLNAVTFMAAFKRTGQIDPVILFERIVEFAANIGDIVFPSVAALALALLSLATGVFRLIKP